jgi:hypothetical protein
MTDKELAARLREHAKPLRRSGQMTHDHIAADLDRAADLIEKMAQAEPVATVYYPRTGGNAGLSWSAIPETGVMPPDKAQLYLAPPARARHVAFVCPQCHWTLEEREPLSDEQIYLLIEERELGSAISIARAVEQAHGIRSEK